MGRPPKPTQQQINEGDPRKHGIHKLEERLAREPKATSGLPPCPSHLKGRARSMWNFWATELEAMDLDKKPDAATLEGACIAYALAVRADQKWQREGIIVDGRRHPAVLVSKDAWQRVRVFCSEFGFSPASRTRIRVEATSLPPRAEEKNDDFADLARPRPPIEASKAVQ